MRPRRTPVSNHVFRLEGGTEDNDLWVEVAPDSHGDTTLRSVWELTDEERAAVAAGANLSLTVMGQGHPPVILAVTDEPLGRGDG